jgi:uncharacterized Zn-binding protein involved in type VI secretion
VEGAQATEEEGQVYCMNPKHTVFVTYTICMTVTIAGLPKARQQDNKASSVRRQSSRI